MRRATLLQCWVRHLSSRLPLQRDWCVYRLIKLMVIQNFAMFVRLGSISPTFNSNKNFISKMEGVHTHKDTHTRLQYLYAHNETGRHWRGRSNTSFPTTMSSQRLEGRQSSFPPSAVVSFCFIKALCKGWSFVQQPGKEREEGMERNMAVSYPHFAICVSCTQCVVRPASVCVRVPEPVPHLIAIFGDLFYSGKAKRGEFVSLHVIILFLFGCSHTIFY